MLAGKRGAVVSVDNLRAVFDNDIEGSVVGANNRTKCHVVVRREKYVEPVPFFGFLETGILYFEKIRR